MRLLVQEARERAQMEAECEHEGEEGAAANGSTTKIRIRADHVTKIVAELLMDFS